MSSDARFDLPGVPTAPPQAEELSADRRRTLRQAELLAAGRHPIGLFVKRQVRLHPDAAPHDDRKAEGLRCGGCRFLTVVGHHTRSYLKCGRVSLSHSAASDIRRSWPACERFEAQEANQ
ncbi:hypothetical protein E1287_25745 [Actinomadura sp. KC06]|uniref:hypothetical protein n=1 Tax=Actinomadura sp. KC06 TaxID=2530369 RepID=UPI0010478232|nr:hypothetical protein [Actinomadura sp. KC06]TDD31667.1 hypothetical protein E1287_25745 [Actinomadura sp. KC06]